MSKLHDQLIVIDGLNVSNFGRSVFEDMRKGGVTAANCTSCVWENFAETMRNFARWKAWFRDNADLITQVYTTQDIARAKREGKTGIILGWQNSSGIEDRIEYLPLFHELGLRIVQLTYNTQNWVGSGCYESRDSGLSDFGRDVLAEMNRLGILCDLSHVGAKTSEDAILASKQRVAYSHCLPAGLKAHPRNKSDEQLKFIADRNGFIGVTMFRPSSSAARRRPSSTTSRPSSTSSTWSARTASASAPTSRRSTGTSSSAGSPTTRAGAASSSTSGRS